MEGIDLEKLMKMLPKNYRLILSEQLGITADAVYKVLKGKFNNEDVIDAAIILAKITVDKNEIRKNLIRNL